MALPAYATPTPQQILAGLQADVATLTAQYNQYNQYYQTYAPARISELQPSGTALTDFTSKVATLTNAVATLNQDAQDLSTAQANLSNQPGVIASTQTSYQDALAAYTAATTAYNAVHPLYTVAQSERDTAYASYQSTAQGGTITETFNNGQKQTAAQFLVNGVTPISSMANANWSIAINEYGGPLITGGMIKGYNPTGTLKIIPPSQTSTTFFQFASGAMNGTYVALVTYTDGTTANMTIINGVEQQYQDVSYNVNQSTTAPQGKYIASITLPAIPDFFYLDSFVFTSQTYDTTAYQTYLDKQAALDSVLITYTPALAAYNAAYQTLVSAETTYNVARAESTTTTLQTLVNTEQSNYEASLSNVQTAISEAQTSKQVIVDALAAVVLPPDSLEVTSTSDQYVEGTLRWAITQANALSGSIYDRIEIKTTEPIVLTSSLPLIGQSVTITSDNKETSIIDGGGAYSAFDMRGSSIILNLSNVTIRNTFASDWQKGSALWVVRGTANVNNVLFTNISQGTAVTTKEGGSYINITNSEFRQNNQGVFSNYGSTPSVTTASDTPYDNRITISGTTFRQNVTAIYGERTVLVDSSQFIGNTFGFKMQGINKHRVTNSLFNGNTYAIYTNSWIPTTWTTFFATPPQGRVIHNNIFKNNINKVITLNDNNSDGKANQSGASIQGNSWDGKGQIFVEYNHYDRINNVNNYYQILSVDDIATHPFAFSGNIDIAPRIDTPTNVQAVVNQDGSVTVTWDAPIVHNTTIERYTIAWSDTQFVSTGWGWNHTLPSVTIPSDIFAETTGLGENVQFRIRADNDTIQTYSQYSTTVEVALPAPPPPTPSPSPAPSETPVIIVPVPAPTEEPVVPTPEPTVEPTPEPTVSPSEEPTPTPSETTVPTPEPTENVVEPTPEPEPSETPKPEPEPELSVEEAVSEIENLVEIAPEKMTDAQIDQLVEAANAVFESAEQGSPAYEQALEALAVAAKADDPEIPSELAAIPLLGDVAGAALEVFNNLGNVGADMAPAVREEAEKTVIASVIAAGAAVNAVAAATTAASGPTGGSSSGGSSSGGSGSTRRKE